MSLIKQAGFQGAAANTMYGIVMAESGGNTNAHNTNASTGDNSYGLAQINMLGAMGPERLKEFGLSSADQLFDPLTNLKVAYRLSGGGTKFNDWTTFTSGKYKDAAPGAVVSNGSSGAGTTGNTLAQPEMTAQQKEQALVDGAGPLGSLLTKIPELHNLLLDAVTRGLTDKEFANEVTNSTWYRTHGDAVRQSIILQYSDPATYQQQLNAAGKKVSDVMRQMGITSGVTNSQYVAMAKQVQMGTITDDDLQKQLSAYFGYGSGHYGPGYKEGSATGTAAQYDTQLRTLYAQYGQAPQPGQLAYRVQQLLSGSAKIEQYEEQAKVAAKAMYPGLSNSIDQGMTVKDLAQPYIQSMSNLLELDPSSIGLNDRMIKQAMQGTGATAKGQQPSATPVWQFEQQVRSDPRWQYTVNAHNETGALLSQLGKDWGFAS